VGQSDEGSIERGSRGLGVPLDASDVLYKTPKTRATKSTQNSSSLCYDKSAHNCDEEEQYKRRAYHDARVHCVMDLLRT
jgi:hypothetical protein